MFYNDNKTILQIAHEAGVGITKAYKIASVLGRKPLVAEVVYLTKPRGRPASIHNKQSLLQKAALAVWDDIEIFFNKITPDSTSIIIAMREIMYSYRFYLGSLHYLDGKPIVHFSNYDAMEEWDRLYSCGYSDDLTAQTKIECILKGDAILTDMIKYLKAIIYSGGIYVN